jgi:hypothetical protein
MQARILNLKSLKSGIIEVVQGSETRTTFLYKKNNGQFAYWCPFSGERIIVGEKNPRTYFDPELNIKIRRGPKWYCKDEIYKLEARMKKNRQNWCPQKER